MLQPVPLKMPKPYAYKNNSNDLKYATLKKALFYTVSGLLYSNRERVL